MIKDTPEERERYMALLNEVAALCLTGKSAPVKHQVDTLGVTQCWRDGMIDANIIELDKERTNKRYFYYKWITDMPDNGVLDHYIKVLNNVIRQKTKEIHNNPKVAQQRAVRHLNGETLVRIEQKLDRIMQELDIAMEVPDMPEKDEKTVEMFPNAVRTSS